MSVPAALHTTRKGGKARLTVRELLPSHTAELQAGEGQGARPAGSRLSSHPHCSHGHCPWCCPRAAHNVGTSIPRTGSQSRGRWPLSSPGLSSLLPGPAPEAAHAAPPTPPQALASADSSQRDKLPAQPKVGETSIPFLSWHFPVEKTSHALSPGCSVAKYLCF